MGKYREKFSKKYYSLYLGLLLIYISGTLIALFRGIGLNHNSNLIYDDLIRSMVFPLSLAFAGFISRIRNIKHIEVFAIFLASIFIVGMVVNRIFGLAMLGDLVKITTIQIFNISAVGFLGLYLLANKYHKNIGRFIILASWGTALLSVVKWNFFPIVILPLIWIILETRGISGKKRLVFCLLVVVILSSILFSFRDNIVRFATGYKSWDSYWHSRVVAGDLFKGGEIKTGRRLEIWKDLLDQFSGSPLLGIGFGARPTFLNVADHNMFIFFLIRFGAPLFCMAVVLSVILIIYMLRYRYINGTSRLILFLLFVYFFQTSMIDTVPFGQMINGLVVGGIAGIILNPRNKHITIKEKINELT